MSEAPLPEVDARCTWKDDYEQLGSYKLKGRCNNCGSDCVVVFTKGYRPHDLSYSYRPKCPMCGCDTLMWRGLAEQSG